MEGERQALLQFKHDLIDDGDRLASWVSEEIECCKWVGIACDNSTGHVHRIHLPGLDGHCRFSDYISHKEYQEASKERFRGNISSSLLHLKQLRHLDISCNDFEGIQIPSFISSLGNLRYLNLSNSKFGGMIPPHLGNLSKLQVLSLGSFHETFNIESTSMSNMQWLSSLHMLYHLHLSSLDLSKATDHWFQVINALPHLAELHLSSCQLSNIHPDVVSLNATSLSLLDLSFNDFNSFVPPWIFSITSLVSLDLSMYESQGFMSSSAYSFRKLTSLEFLHVHGNHIMNSSSVLKDLSSSAGSNLILLDIGSCGISSPVLDSLHNLTSLLSLDLSDNQLTKSIPKSLCNLCNLRELDLSYMQSLKISLTYILESFFGCNSPALESLFLMSMGLSGHIPDQVGKLVNLEHIDLEFNHINGTIPYSIGRLSSLRTISLIWNKISGSIPSSIGRLSSLEVLYLYRNKLNGSVPSSFGQLSKLEHLDVSYNFLTGPIPNSIGRLSSLVHLDLSNNQFTGTLPESLGHLYYLSFFRVFNNKLTGSITTSHFTNLSALKIFMAENNKLTLLPSAENWVPPFHLEVLRLGSWNIGPNIPIWLQSQRELRHLDIANTGISDIMPSWFWSSFSNIRYLNISYNNIQGKLTGSRIIFGQFPVVYLSNNHFEGPLPGKFNKVNFVFLDVSYNKLSGSLDQFLCPSVKEVRDLWVLDVANNNLSGGVPDCWLQWKALMILNFENNGFSGEIPQSVGSLSYLQVFNVRNNKLSGNLPAFLFNIKWLQIIELASNEFTGRIPLLIGNQESELKLLSLRSNKLEGEIPYELCRFTSIRILDLAHNNLSGNLPSCFYNFSSMSQKQNLSVFLKSEATAVYGSYQVVFDFKVQVALLVTKGSEYEYSTTLFLVTALDLSDNQFSGPIPKELMSLVGLRYMNFSGNNLKGRIPEEIGKMTLLESLDLSTNQLDGTIPRSISTLTYLNSLNLSFNHLTGEIPTSTQLRSFTESSFKGNTLCGPPLVERCNKNENSHDDKVKKNKMMMNQMY